MLQWIVTVAKQNQDHIVARGCREQRFADVYLPKTYKKVTTANGGKRPMAALLMSPYLFVLLDISRGEHGPLMNTRGVDRLLCDLNGRPEPLRNGGFEFIAELRQAEDEELFSAGAISVGARTDLTRGMHVRIDKQNALMKSADGEFVNMQGTITQIRKKRVQVLVGTKDVWVDDVDVSIIQ